jgi:hypothetical protein
MCVSARNFGGDAGEKTRGACSQEIMLEETDSAANVGCRQFREARSE